MGPNGADGVPSEASAPTTAPGAAPVFPRLREILGADAAAAATASAARQPGGGARGAEAAGPGSQGGRDLDAIWRGLKLDPAELKKARGHSVGGVGAPPLRAAPG